jgi:50S ribosomal subunit-associated GTPase HflX
VSALLALLLHIQDALHQVVGLAVLDAEDPEALGTVDTCHDTLQDLNVDAWFSRFVVE